MTQGKLVVVPVIQHVHQVGIERVHIVQFGELSQLVYVTYPSNLCKNHGEFVMVVLLRELHFTHVEITNAGDVPATSHVRRGKNKKYL